MSENIAAPEPDEPARIPPAGPARGTPVRDGRLVVVVFVALILVTAIAMIVLRLQGPGHSGMDMGIEGLSGASRLDSPFSYLVS